jgi:hypothetical protein
MAFHGGEAEKSGVVSGIEGELGFGGGLEGFAAEAGDFHEGAVGGELGVDGLGGEAEDGFEEVVLGIADGELGGVDTDGKAPGAGVEVIADEGALVLLGPGAVLIEGEGAGGDDLAFVEVLVPGVHGMLFLILSRVSFIVQGDCLRGEDMVWFEGDDLEVEQPVTSDVGRLRSGDVYSRGGMGL